MWVGLVRRWSDNRRIGGRIFRSSVPHTDHMEAETLPVLRNAAESAGRNHGRDGGVSHDCCMGETTRSARCASKAAAQLAFYGSTPAYAGF
ncbi:MAG: hypothetical protein Ct9H300mP26_0860 [Acidimicrobiales bacterium]|nr:MAG: hypothetical protein Ct9H300mP26_0860 [Acidimicrobiales bacterium]